MNTFARITAICGFFFIIVGVAYTFLTGTYEPSGFEWVGVPAIFGLSGLMFMMSIYSMMTTRRFNKQAQDDHAGEVHDEAGVQGTFAPYSWAPLWASLGASIVFIGLPIGWWLMVLGFIVAAYGVITWVMAHSTGFHAH